MSISSRLEGPSLKLVSIVLPTYNGASYLDESIQSILRQTYQNWELIIVDDCSTDSTPSIIAKYAKLDSRIKPQRNANNIKLPASLNFGFANASGDYFTWTSDDNLFEENAIETMVNALENNPGTDLVYCNVTRIGGDGNPVKIKQFSTASLFLYVYNVVQACFLYRSTLHQELGGYDTSLYLVEDYDFWIRAFRSHRFIHINETHYRYRMHAKSLTSTREREIREKTVALLEREISSGGLSPIKQFIAKVGLAYNKAMYKKSIKNS